MGFTWESVEELASLHDEPEWLRRQCRAAFGVYEKLDLPSAARGVAPSDPIRGAELAAAQGPTVIG